MDNVHEYAVAAKARFGVCLVGERSSYETHPGVQAVCEGLLQHRHVCVDGRSVRNALEPIRLAVLDAVESGTLDALVLVGGMGLGKDDITSEALELLWHKKLPGFGEFLRSKAIPSMGAQVVFSCAEAGLVARTLVFAVPASLEVCKVAASQVIGPVLSYGIALMHSRN